MGFGVPLLWVFSFWNFPSNFLSCGSSGRKNTGFLLESLLVTTRAWLRLDAIKTETQTGLFIFSEKTSSQFFLDGLSPVHLCVSVTQLCPILCDLMDHNPSSSSVHGILQARILEWATIPFSRGSSQPRDHTQVSWIADILYHSSHQGSPSLLHS